MSMAHQSLFSGLIVDAFERPVDVASIGGEAFYVVDDDGFRRHVESEYVDKQVLRHLQEMMKGHEELISEETMKMIGQDDIFTKAVIETSLKNLDSRFDELINQGMPEEARTWLGMIGFRVVIDIHGDVVRVEQPGASTEPND
jgi:PHD/YefM family antitoxin component YafN of YafNO toxin-antitoxin module